MPGHAKKLSWIVLHAGLVCQLQHQGPPDDRHPDIIHLLELSTLELHTLGISVGSSNSLGYLPHISFWAMLDMQFSYEGGVFSAN